MAGTSPRQTQYQLVHYIRFAVNYNDTGIATGVKKGTIPAGAVLIGSSAHVTAAFNAVTTNVLTVGTSTTLTEIISAAALTETATGVTLNIPPNASPFLIDLAADQDVYVAYTQTGTAATAGRAVITVYYVPNNDL